MSTSRRFSYQTNHVTRLTSDQVQVIQQGHPHPLGELATEFGAPRDRVMATPRARSPEVVWTIGGSDSMRLRIPYGNQVRLPSPEPAGTDRTILRPSIEGL